MCDCISKINGLARKDGYELDLVVVEDNSGSVSIAPRVVLKKIGATGYRLKNYRFIVGRFCPFCGELIARNKGCEE